MRRSSPWVLVYRTTLSPRSTLHDRSVGTGPASMRESVSRRAADGRSRVKKRRRTVRGLTKVISRGNAGSRSYSVPGNSFELARASTMSILLNE